MGDPRKKAGGPCERFSEVHAHAKVELSGLLDYFAPVRTVEERVCTIDKYESFTYSAV